MIKSQVIDFLTHGVCYCAPYSLWTNITNSFLAV